MQGYEIEDTLGVGGMGTVFRARVEGTEQRVAVKILHEELSAIESYRVRFEREVHAMCRVKSEHVVQVLDVVMNAPRPYFAMELLHGRDLRARLSAGPMLLREVLSIGLELACAIRTLHEHGIIHRDLKPSNVFLVEGGDALEIKILDFGIAKVTDEFAFGVTSASSTIGTLSHMAPEQFLHSDRASNSSDVWALGVMLFEMLTSSHPFRQNEVSMPIAILERPPVSISDRRTNVPEGLCDLIYRALTKDPMARLTIDEMDIGLRRELARLDASFMLDDMAGPLDETVPSLSAHRQSYIREVQEAVSEEATTQVDDRGKTSREAPLARYRSIS